MSHAEEMGAAQAELQRAVQRCAALQSELDLRAAPEEVAALRARIETLRHLVDAQEEAEGACTLLPHCDTTSHCKVLGAGVVSPICCRSLFQMVPSAWKCNVMAGISSD